MTGVLIGGIIFLLVLIGIMVFVVINQKKKNEAKNEEQEQEKKVIHTTQNQLPFEYIRRGIVKLKSGQFVRVLQVPAINVQLMEGGERELVREVYGGVLNSLDFKIQFVKQSRLVDIKEYLQFLKEKENKAENSFRARGIREYHMFIAELVKENSVQTKKDFIAIPYIEENTKIKNKTEDSMKKYRRSENEDDKKTGGEENEEILLEEKRFDKAYKALIQREKTLSNQLRRLGIVAHPMDDKELFELYYITYNKERSNYQTLKGVDPNNFTTLYVKRDEGVR